MDDRISQPTAYFLVGLLALSIVFTSAGVSQLVNSREKAAEVPASIVTADGYVKKVDFPNVPLVARAAVVYDVKRGEVLFEKNARAQLPLASLTKIMMALTARDELPKDAVVTINEEFLQEEGNNGFRDGQEWKLSDILDATLVESSNDGAAAIAGAYAAFQKEATEVEEGMDFVSLMNEKAKALGLEQTYFLNPTGLDTSASVSGGYGSAHDMAKLFSFAIQKFPDAFEATRYKDIVVSSLGKTEYTISNTNDAIDQIPGLVASKTGYTDLAGGNLVILFDAGPMHPVAVAVLGSTLDGRFSDTISLVDATLRYLGEQK